MYAAHTSTLLFKDNHLRREVPTSVSTFDGNFDQFRLSWRSGTNHTPRILTGISLQRKGPDRGTSLQTSNHRFGLVKVDTCFLLLLGNCLFPLHFVRQTGPKDVIIVRGHCRPETGSEWDATKDWPRLHFVAGAPKREHTDDRRQSFRTDCSFAKNYERFPFICTTNVRLWSNMLHHLRNSNSRSPESPP